MKIISKINDEQQGLSVLELTVVVLMVGILTVGALTLLGPFIHAARLIETQEKIKAVADALNGFAVANYRLPCPAEPRRNPADEPYGFADGSGAAGATVPAICAATQGIVPFRTLGLQENMVVDGWGGYLTYAVSPSFTRLSNTPGSAAPNVHAACRTREWMHETLLPNGESGFENRNPRKARFCCPDESGGADLTVLDDNDTNVLAIARAAGPYGYAAPNIKMDPYDMSSVPPAPYRESTVNIEANKNYYLQPQVPLPQFRATGIAYILVSHGPDREGVFMPNINGATLEAARVGFVAGKRQAENANNDNVFFDHAEIIAADDNTKIDDVVLWRTQDAIFAAKGKSCATP